ncbi:uncharacterized protein LOC141707685 isoform X2 [Apium graveolens]|uniref:uncharacterized protein LOC141707685 isoform X2 n=1 Tax=Apium graveolens TaxID=4045 RepID=UPI003D7A068D
MASYAAATIGISLSTNSSTTSPTSTVIDVNHPYYLSNSDNPCIPLVTQMLTDQNYSQWSRSASIALSAKMKLGIIDGTLPKPLPTSTMYPLWFRCNDMVLSWLLNSMTIEIRNSVAYFSTAKRIWEDLAVRFSQTNMPRVFQLRKELGSMNQNNMAITTYFTKFRTVLVEIENLDPMPKCTCAVRTGCTCQNAQKLEKYEEMIKLSQFIMGLNDQYTTVRGQLLMMKLIPSLTQTFSLLLQEESQRDFAKMSSHNPLSESMAMNVKYKNLSKFKNSGHGLNAQKRQTSDIVTAYCDFCQNSGHTRDKCFCLHGYPQWHGLHGNPKPKPKKLSTSGVKSAAQITVGHDVAAGSQIHMDNSAKDSVTFSEPQCLQLSKVIQETLK